MEKLELHLGFWAYWNGLVPRNLHTCSLLISLPSFHFPNKLRSDLLPLSFPHPCLTISQPEYGTLALRLCVGVHVRAQSSLTLCGPMDCSLPGSSVHGFLQARILIIYLFSLLVMLPSVVPRLATNSAVRVFPDIWKPLFSKAPFLGRSSVPTSFVSLFIFYIFSYLLSGAQCPPWEFRCCFMEFAQHSNDLSMNLWGESGFPILFLCHLRTSS